jgi:hypothetical protein
LGAIAGSFQGFKSKKDNRSSNQNEDRRKETDTGGFHGGEGGKTFGLESKKTMMRQKGEIKGILIAEPNDMDFPFFAFLVRIGKIN